MKERIEMQKPLDIRQLTRDFLENYWFFRINAGFDLELEVLNRLQYADTTVLEAGCGSGAGIEHLVRQLGAFAQKNKYGGRLAGIGLDLNPLPDLIPHEILATYPGEHTEDTGTITDLIGGDVCNMPIDDNTIDVGYSPATLIYVVDTLKALSEGYRVLKAGGVFIWEICEKQLTFKPTFAEILEQTPGAEAFKYIKSEMEPDTGCVVCRKPETGIFKGFPYRVVGKAHLPGVEEGTLRAFYRIAIYGRIE